MPDITTTQIFSDGEKGITATKMNNIIANSVIQPDFVTAKPSSSTLDPTDQLLEVKGAGTYARITGQQLIDSVSASVTQNITPTITAVRLRSLNILGNPTFEADQINIGNVVANANAKIIDRWGVFKGAAPLAVSAQQLAAVWTSPIVVPGTNFVISNNYLRVTLTTQQASLGTSDVLQITQNVEGPRFRELSFDVHSMSLLVRSSVAGLKFGLNLRDMTPGKSLSKLCTIPSASTWTLITLPNLPVWPSTGSFGITPGVQAFYLGIVLAAGTSITVPANDTWQNGNFVGALGQDNFASKPLSSTFDIAFIQHEPGSQCTTPMDCPFGQNLDGDMGCLRYFTKSYDYSTLAGTVTNNGIRSFSALTGSAAAYGPVSFHKPMAKVPTITPYNHSNGAANSVGDGGGVNHTGAAAFFIGSSGFGGISFTGATSGAMPVYAHYTADTGW